MMLCEAQLGDSLIVTAPARGDRKGKKHPEGQREGKHSSYARGMVSLPELVDAGKELARPDLCGVKMPYGSVTIRDNESESTDFPYDEHVVYSELQVRLR